MYTIITPTRQLIQQVSNSPNQARKRYRKISQYKGNDTSYAHARDVSWILRLCYLQNITHVLCDGTNVVSSIFLRQLHQCREDRTTILLPALLEQYRTKSLRGEGH